MLGAFENARVGRIWVCDELHLGDSADRVGHFDSFNGHAVRNDIVREVHILIEKRLESGSAEEHLSRLVLKAVFPEQLQLADRRQSLILWCVTFLCVFRHRALGIRIISVPLRVIDAPIVGMVVSFLIMVRLAGCVLVSL